MNHILTKLANWYFTKDAMPYWIVFLFDCLVIILSNLIVYTLTHGGFATSLAFRQLLPTLLIYLIPYIIGFRLFHTYSGVVRYSSFADLYRIAAANLFGIVVVEGLRFFLHTDNWLTVIRFRELLFAWLMATFIMFSVRILIKYMYDRLREDRAHRGVFIYGCKSGGMMLAKAIRMEDPARFTLRGFISDSDDLPGHILQGVRVYENNSDIIHNMRKEHADTLLVSPLKIDEFNKNEELKNALLDADIKVFIMKRSHQWDGKSDLSSSELQEVQIEDLLPRDEIEVNMQEIEEMLRGKCIMVTGSAGSIGSEMVRQIASFGPSQMVLIDEAETPQHDIRLMMRKEFPEVPACIIVTSITKHRRMESLFAQFKPDYVFHAAAYKHVPMMEDNPSEAVQNNVDGTRVIADLAVKYGVKKFVMISTDKAVNPTNVMGCSKRICEIYVQSLDKYLDSNSHSNEKAQSRTQFVTTRFGNVLGSNGSVIPLFKEQIRKGGPVTVTHPDIIRYFMLIPEACKLVLEAGTMGKGGEIFVFDMGKPVKIADLAKKMIQLSGAKNVEIKFTGLRDGEKLYEEVLNDKEITKPTFHKKIKIAQVRQYDYDEVSRLIEQLVKTSYLYDDMETVRIMKQIVPEYKSKNSIYEQLDNQ